MRNEADSGYPSGRRAHFKTNRMNLRDENTAQTAPKVSRHPPSIEPKVPN